MLSQLRGVTQSRQILEDCSDAMAVPPQVV